MPAHAEFAAWLLPPAGRNEWLALAEILAESGPAPCETGNAAAWWPDKKGVHSVDTRGAIEDCRRCRARYACLAYALAADERYGIWGGKLPDERKRPGILAA